MSAAPAPPSRRNTPSSRRVRKPSSIENSSNGTASKPSSPNQQPANGGERTVKKLRLSKALTISEGTAVSDACRRMAHRRVDAVLLTDADGLLSGIVTDKDIAVRVIADGLKPEQTLISKIMTRNPVFVTSDMLAIEALQKMVQGKFRHLPVVENGEVIAILDITKCLYDAISRMEKAAEQSSAIAAAVEGVERQWGNNFSEMSKSRKGPKTSEGNRSDPAWKYCVQLEMEETQKAKGYVYVQCNFCGKRITGGVARLKHHLAKTGKNVKGCAQVPDEVLNEMKAILSSNEEKSKRAMMEMEELCRAGSFEMQNPFGAENQAISPSGSSNMKRARGPMDFFVAGPSPLGSPSPTTTIGTSGHQSTLNETWKKEERNRVCRTIGRFFFENGLPFNCASSPSFSTMLHAVGSFGRGLKPPSAYELKSWILKEEVKSIWDVMGEARASWAETGCSIMSDGWTDVKGRSLINFLVNNPKGTWFLKSVDASDKVKNATLLFHLLDEIVEEVGECNVLQVITDNASNYKAAGQLLMEKRKHLYWTPCAAHCIDLMLEDILKLPLPASVFKKAKRIINYIYAHGWVLAMVRKQIGGDLVRPAVTRFATAFLTLQKLMSMKDPLESFFTSSKWKKSPYASKPQGKSVSQTILRSKTFWPGVAYVIRTTKPLVMVLRMVDSEKYPPMGFIYEAMDRAKEEIAKALGNDETKYRTLWDIVDDRWDRQLHTNLHAAAYFLNPQCQYEPSFSKHFEIKKGLFDCIARIIEDQSVREKIDLQIDAFKHARGFFGWESAISTRKKRSPADWWSQFGDECPELQKFAIRVLSLTCSASGCERNWSSFNQIHTKRRNRLTQAKLNDLVYVMFNLKLKQREIRRKTMEDPLCLDDVDSSDEWVSELQSCDFEAFQELDANTPIEDEVVEAEDEADQQDNSRRKRRKDKAHYSLIETLRDRMFKPSLSTIISENTKVAVVLPSDPVYLATKKMRDNQVHSVVIANGGKPQGILTSKDVLMRVVAHNLSPEVTFVEKVMTASPECATLDTTILDALHILHDGKFLHLPVVNQDGCIVACLDVLQLTHAALSMVDGGPGTVNDMTGTMMQKFWDSALALDPSDEDLETNSEVSALMTSEGAETGKSLYPPLGLANSFSFKFQDKKGRMHRLSCGAESLGELLNAVTERICAGIDRDNIQLLYEDDEGDRVMLVTDSDLVGAINQARISGSKVLRLHIENPSKEGEVMRSSSNLTATQQSRLTTLHAGVIAGAVLLSSISVMVYLKRSTL